MSERYKLLVVDDDEAMIDYLHAKLGERFDIVSTNAPENVLNLARTERPHLILCDINMPEMDGGDVSKALHAHPEVRTVPMLFLTALISPDELKNTGNLIGGRPAISKQASIPELEKRIRQLIERKT
ncbi:MAG TPA: response regulator [Burkholderiales bacterium]|jgi:CheY-like chemotaxis protein|nr:response regulator [Burkholderiales bacterium]